MHLNQSTNVTKQCENVNGTILTLTVNKTKTTTCFTIWFGAHHPRTGSFVPRLALVLAITINFLAVLYIKLSLATLLVTVSVLGVLTLLWATHSVQYESTLVMPAMGIQNSIKYVWGSKEEFTSWSDIDDIIINEVIQHNRVLYFLTILVKDSEDVKLVPLFKFTKPRLNTLQSIYGDIQTLLSQRRHDTGNGAG